MAITRAFTAVAEQLALTPETEELVAAEAFQLSLLLGSAIAEEPFAQPEEAAFVETSVHGVAEPLTAIEHAVRSEVKLEASLASLEIPECVPLRQQQFTSVAGIVSAEERVEVSSERPITTSLEELVPRTPCSMHLQIRPVLSALQVAKRKKLSQRRSSWRQWKNGRINVEEL